MLSFAALVPSVLSARRGDIAPSISISGQVITIAFQKVTIGSPSALQIAGEETTISNQLITIGV